MRLIYLNLISLIALICPSVASAQDFDYDVHWKWGLIDLDIATAHVSISNDNGDFLGTINGHSIPWEGRVYCISDTLQGKFTPSMETVYYLNGWYSKPLVGHEASYSDPATFANLKGEGTLDADAATMEAVYVTASMSSIFYYAKVLDFESMAPGSVISIPIAGQSGNDELQIVYNGEGSSTTDGVTPIFKISFRYKYKGRLDNYPAQCEISQTERLPIFFSADIAIGHVDMSLR